MEIIEFLTNDNKEYWLGKLSKCKWSAGKVLYDLLVKGTAEEYLGKKPRVYMLTEGGELMSFCTLSQKDNVPGYRLTPWVGFVYTFPKYRGHRFSQMLLRHCEKEAYNDGYRNVYISTSHVGLYEKYGYEFYDWQKDNNGDNARIYKKRLKKYES